MSRKLVLMVALGMPVTVQAALIELTWHVVQGEGRGQWTLIYAGYVTTFSDIPVAAGPGRLYIHARGDYSPGLDDADPELIAFDLDGVYAPVERDGRRQFNENPNRRIDCMYPGVFPSVEDVAASPPASSVFVDFVHCLPLAGPEKGASILAIHGGSVQDVEWEQEFFLDHASLRMLTADNELRLNASTLEADVLLEQAAPPYFEFRLSYEVPETGSLGLLTVGLVVLGVASRRRRDSGADMRTAA